MKEITLKINKEEFKKKLGIKDGKPGKPGKNAVVDYKRIQKDVLKEIKVKDGYTPKKGVDYFDGEPGESIDEKKVIKAVIKEVLKHIPETDTMNQYGYATGGMNDARLKFFVKDLSGDLNGSLKTFTIPQNVVILDIASSSRPWTFRPTVDYTISGISRETLTFTSEIDETQTLAVGQTLIVTGIRP